MRFTDEPLPGVRQALAAALAQVPPGGRVVFEAPHPDQALGAFYDGELGPLGRVRSLGAWLRLAEGLQASLECPTPLPGGFAVFGLVRLDPSRGAGARGAPSGHPERYGAASAFARIDKFEAPEFLEAWYQAVRFLRVPAGARILSLGCHTGAELGFFAAGGGAPSALVGWDHSPSALAAARARWPDPVFAFEEVDLVAALGADPPPGGGFDLVVAVNVLHSPSLPGPALLRRLVRAWLAPGGRLLLGWPACRYVDHRVLAGPPVKHAAGPDLALLLRDVMAARRYLHQQGFETRAAGQHSLLLAARRPGGLRSS